MSGKIDKMPIPAPDPEAIKRAVKDAVLAVDPGAAVILYGSRARGDAQPDSDWDFLVLHDGPESQAKKDAIRGALLNVEFETDQIVLAITHSREYWALPIVQVSPFYRNVTRDGIPL